MTLNGCLAGLVAITASCAFVSVPNSLIIGTIAGMLVVFSVIFFDKVHLDDPVGALSVHLVNGVFGTLCVGLFAQDKIAGISIHNGLFYGGGTKLLMVQLSGILAVAFFTFVISLVFWLVLKYTMGVRVSLKEEIEGLDIGEHGNSAYPEFSGRKQAYSFIKVEKE
jgi:Amt family ammonium transporter